MSLNVYRIECVFNVAQHLSETGRFEPMGLSSFLIDRGEVANRLDYCQYGSHNSSKCAQDVLDQLAVNYQTYTSSYGRNDSQTVDASKLPGTPNNNMVAVNGNLKVLHYKDEEGNPLIGNVIPVNSDINLATDWVKATVTAFIAPPYPDFVNVDKLGAPSRGLTVKLHNRDGGIGGITRDADNLIVTMRSTPEIMLYPLIDIIFGNFDHPKIVGLKCKDESGENRDVILNEIDYYSILWGVPRNSDRLMLFDLKSGNCTGVLDFVDAMNKYAEGKRRAEPQGVRQLEVDFLPHETVINGINFIARNWLIVSPWNSSTRFIVKITDSE